MRALSGLRDMTSKWQLRCMGYWSMGIFIQTMLSKHLAYIPQREQAVLILPYVYHFRINVPTDTRADKFKVLNKQFYSWYIMFLFLCMLETLFIQFFVRNDFAVSIQGKKKMQNIAQFIRCYILYFLLPLVLLKLFVFRKWIYIYIYIIHTDIYINIYIYIHIWYNDAGFTTMLSFNMKHEKLTGL